MGTKHKHRDVIIAWANGEDVQWKPYSEAEWIDLTCDDPSFHEYYDFRIKPKRVKKEGWLNVYGLGSAYVWPTKEEADRKSNEIRVACIRIEWEEEE